MPISNSAIADVGATILVVEDEVLLAMVLDEVLTGRGHCVHLAFCGREGLETLESGIRLDALITDIRLPEVDGWAIARRAREKFPGVPVIYMSGDSAAQHASKGVTHSAMMAKPFAMDVFTTTVTALLAEPPSPAAY